uniref:Uncharacterized protein n=1 Tax=Cacopsylla melanoneura TaxID=428564 RepID=A0A8D8WVT4_9HEMI
MSGRRPKVYLCKFSRHRVFIPVLIFFFFLRKYLVFLCYTYILNFQTKEHLFSPKKKSPAVYLKGLCVLFSIVRTAGIFYCSSGTRQNLLADPYSIESRLEDSQNKEERCNLGTR